MLDGTLPIQIPQNHQASAVADQHLPWVERVLMQSFNTLQIPAANIILWNSGKVAVNRSAITKSHYNSHLRHAKMLHYTIPEKLFEECCSVCVFSQRLYIELQVTEQRKIY